MEKFIVIGAGIAGASTAYHLAKRGNKVIIFDRGNKGQATDAAAGIICPWLSQRRNKKWYQLVKNSAAYYPNMIQSLQEDGEEHTGYSKVGALSLHDDEKKLEEKLERAYQRRKAAPEIGTIQKLDTAQTKAKFPLLHDRYQSVYVSGGARVNGRLLRNALLNGAKKYGATFIHEHASLRRERHQIIGVKAGEQTFHADKVIAANGVWMNELLAPLSIPVHVSSQKAQIMHLRMPNVDTYTWPVVLPPNNQYMLTLADSRIIIGATHEKEAGFDTTTTAGGINEILTKALHVAPSLAPASLMETRVGFRPFTEGSLPVFGELPGIQGLLFANGLGASGLTMGPYIGSLLASLATGDEPDIDVSSYSVTT